MTEQEQRSPGQPRLVASEAWTEYLQYTFLEVDDHEAALAFYRDALGLEVRHDVALEYGRWLTVGPPGQPELGIVLHPVGVGRPPEDADPTVAAGQGFAGRRGLHTGDVDATFETIRASGADVIQEPMDQPYGVRDCAFRDPAGNEVRINQPSKG